MYLCVAYLLTIIFRVEGVTDREVFNFLVFTVTVASGSDFQIIQVFLNFVHTNSKLGLYIVTVVDINNSNWNTQHGVVICEVIL